MAASKSLVLLLAALAVTLAQQSARVARQAPHYGAWPHGAAHEDDGSYWPGKYGPEGDDVVPAASHAAPAWPHAAPGWPHAAPAWPHAAPAAYHAAPAWPHAAPAAYHAGGDDGSYYPGKYGPENQ